VGKKISDVLRNHPRRGDFLEQRGTVSRQDPESEKRKALQRKGQQKQFRGRASYLRRKTSPPPERANTIRVKGTVVRQKLFAAKSSISSSTVLEGEEWRGEGRFAGPRSKGKKDKKRGRTR